MVKLPGGGHLFLLPAAADRRLVSVESIVGLIRKGDGGGGDGAEVRRTLVVVVVVVVRGFG